MDTKYFKVGGFTIRVNSEISFKTDTFHETLKFFETADPGYNDIVITHHFSDTIPSSGKIKNRIYYKRPWAVFKQEDQLIYEWIQDYSIYDICRRKVVVNREHTIIDTYNNAELAQKFSRGGLKEISMLPTDQIFLSRALAYRQGCIIHSMGMIQNGKGYLFIGHSGAGKSTMAKLMQQDATILCDDRNVIRKETDNYQLYGTWRHSDVSAVSPLSASLKSIFFLNQSEINHLHHVDNYRRSFKQLLSCLVKPLTFGGWWELSFNILSDLANTVDCWEMRFDKSGTIKDNIIELIGH